MMHNGAALSLVIDCIVSGEDLCVQYENLLENTCIIDPFNLRGLVPSTPSETLEHRYPGCGGEGAPYLSSFLSESCDNLDTTSVASLIPHELQEKSHFLAMARRVEGLMTFLPSLDQAAVIRIYQSLHKKSAGNALLIHGGCLKG